jgi:hypothetical protein
MDDTTLRIDVAEVSEISVGWSSVLMHGFTTFVVSAFALKVEAILFRATLKKPPPSPTACS